MDKTQYNSLVVRVAAPADAAALAALAREMLEYERSLNEYAGELTPWAASPDEMRKQIQRPGVRFFVAGRYNQLVGYIKAAIYGQRPRGGESGTPLGLEEGGDRAARGVCDFVIR